MTMSRISALMLAAVFAAPTLANAQTDAAAGSGLVGPAVPGVCVLSREAVFANAKVGLVAVARLKALADQAQGALDQERTPLAADAKALEAQRASLTAAQLKPRQDALAVRVADLQRHATLKSREIEATRAKVTGRIATEAQPVIAQVYQARRCGILFSRDAMLGGNPAADLTGDVVKGLDGRITTISFNLETLADTPPAVAKP
jgi:Skp family chaperone for outer membrane proteins